jgi:hypothetical protein
MLMVPTPVRSPRVTPKLPQLALETTRNLHSLTLFHDFPDEFQVLVLVVFLLRSVGMPIHLLLQLCCVRSIRRLNFLRKNEIAFSLFVASESR